MQNIPIRPSQPSVAQPVAQSSTIAASKAAAGSSVNVKNAGVAGLANKFQSIVNRQVAVSNWGPLLNWSQLFKQKQLNTNGFDKFLDQVELDNGTAGPELKTAINRFVSNKTQAQSLPEFVDQVKRHLVEMKHQRDQVKEELQSLPSGGSYFMKRRNLQAQLTLLDQRLVKSDVIWMSLQIFQNESTKLTPDAEKKPIAKSEAVILKQPIEESRAAIEIVFHKAPVLDQLLFAEIVIGSPLEVPVFEEAKASIVTLAQAEVNLVQVVDAAIALDNLGIMVNELSSASLNSSSDSRVLDDVVQSSADHLLENNLMGESLLMAENVLAELAPDHYSSLTHSVEESVDVLLNNEDNRYGQNNSKDLLEAVNQSINQINAELNQVVFEGVTEAQSLLNMIPVPPPPPPVAGEVQQHPKPSNSLLESIRNFKADDLKEIKKDSTQNFSAMMQEGSVLSVLKNALFSKRQSIQDDEDDEIEVGVEINKSKDFASSVTSNSASTASLVSGVPPPPPPPPAPLPPSSLNYLARNTKKQLPEPSQATNTREVFLSAIREGMRLKQIPVVDSFSKQPELGGGGAFNTALAEYVQKSSIDEVEASEFSDEEWDDQ